ncbi:MAG: cytochrome C oxidase subunit IV family protein [Firmicutes bacterium]|nr:cytochrome C oxidase subunit IV family protein [Bacillota bacterium]
MMNFLDDDTKERKFHEENFPWKGIIGYIMSIVLTIFAFWFSLDHVSSLGPTLFVILALAVLQIFVQMFMFMHVTESDKGFPWQTFGLISGLIFVIAIVALSMWIMTFSSMAS